MSFTLLVIISLGGLSLETRADSVERAGNFFPKDSARDVFGGHIQMGTAPEAKPWLPTPKPFEVQDAQTGENSVQQNSQKAGTSIANAVKTPAQPLDTALREAQGQDPVADDLVNKYGNPNGEAPITVVDNAPLPFKGMMAALAEKRDDIAMLYARQYVRHMNNLKSRAMQVQHMMQGAVQDEMQQRPDSAIAQGSAQKNSDLRDSNMQLMPRVRRESPQARLELEARAREIFEKAKANRDLQPDAEAFSYQDQTGGRATTRAPLNAPVPGNYNPGYQNAYPGATEERSR